MSSRMNAANARTIAFKWVSTDPTIPDKSISSFLKINLAHNYNDYRNALKEYVAPAQNFIFADVDGNIGYQMPGKVPRRANGHTGKRPISGDGRFAWQTTTTTSSRDGTTTTATASIDFDHMPRAYNPPKGFFASANNRVVPPVSSVTGEDPFAKQGYVLSHDWDGSNMGYRSRSITRMIEDWSDNGMATRGKAPPRKLNMTGMQHIQLSYASGLWEDFSPFLSRLLTETSAAALLSSASKEWIPKLVDNTTTGFRGIMKVGAIEPTLFQQWLLRVLQLISKVPTSNSFQSSFLPKRMFNVNWVLGALANGHPACNMNSPQSSPTGGRAVRSGGSVVSSSSSSSSSLPSSSSSSTNCLAFAAVQLNQVIEQYQVGNTMKKPVPRWGIDVHRAVFEHQILHTTPLACLGDRQVEHGGDDSTVNVGHVNSDAAMTQTAGPSYRHLVDLSAPDVNSLFLNPLGQSGDVFSYLYDNLLNMWSTGRYMKMGQYEETSRQAGNDVRVLVNR